MTTKHAQVIGQLNFDLTSKLQGLNWKQFKYLSHWREDAIHTDYQLGLECIILTPPQCLCFLVRLVFRMLYAMYSVCCSEMNGT